MSDGQGIEKINIGRTHSCLSLVAYASAILGGTNEVSMVAGVRFTMSSLTRDVHHHREHFNFSELIKKYYGELFFLVIKEGGVW